MTTDDLTVTCMCKDGHHKDWHNVGSGCYYGDQHELPWERDGIKFCAYGWNDAKSKWGMDTNEFKGFDLIEAVADYYLLDALRWDMANARPHIANKPSIFVQLHQADKWRDCCDTRMGDMKHGPGCTAKQQKPKASMSDEQAVAVLEMIATLKEIPASMRVVQARAWIKHAAIAEKAADVLRRYAHYAIAGELSHYGKSGQSFQIDNYGHMRAGWWRFVQHVGGAKAAAYAKEIFEYEGWSNAYGGKAWASIADVLYRYESGEWDAWLFVDRIITLQHNTGSALNKVSWKQNIATGQQVAIMNEPDHILDAHANAVWPVLLKAASAPVRSLFKDYWILANNDWAKRGESGKPMPTAEDAHKCGSSYCNAWLVDSDYCKSHTTEAPVAVIEYCVECGKVLNHKEITHDQYHGKCEVCAKTNNCSVCDKAIVPSKDMCDNCKQSGKKPKVVKSKAKKQNFTNAWSDYYAVSNNDDDVKVIGYTIVQPDADAPKAKKKKQKPVIKAQTSGKLSDMLAQLCDQIDVPDVDGEE